MTSKACTKCGECKPLTEFHVRSRAVDGRQSQCRCCAAAQAYAIRQASLSEYCERQRNRNGNRDPEMLRQQSRAYYHRETKRIKARRKTTLPATRLRELGYRNTLADFYVKQLVTQGTGLSLRDIPPELVELKREQLLTKRAVRALEVKLKESR